MRKRMVALVLASAMTVTTLLTGCGQETEKPSEESTSVLSEEKQAESSEEKVEELEPYTVTYWMMGDESKDHEMVMEKINEKIQETLPNTTLEMVYVSSSEYKDRWNKALAAGEKIDLGWSAGWVNPVADDVMNGVVLPVEDLLKEYGQGIVDALGWETLDNHHSADGVLYFMPSWQGMVGGRNGVVLDAACVELMPEGWLEEAEQTFFEHQKFTREDKEVLTGVIDEYLETAAANDMLGNGLSFNAATLGIERIFTNGVSRYKSVVYVANNDGEFTVGSYYDCDAIRFFYEKAAEWYQKGYIRSDVASAPTNDDGTYIAWAEQAVASTWLDNMQMKSTTGQKITGFLIGPTNSLKTGFETGTVIPYTCENPERAMQVLNLLYSDAEIYQLLVYGIEGTHYMKNANGTITLPSADNKTYQGPDNWKVGTCMNSLTEDGASLTYYADLKAEEETATVDPLIGFAFDASNVTNEVNNCNAVKNEYQGILLRGYYGEKWEACLDEYMKKLYDAGLQTIIDEVARQLTEYVEENNLGTVVVK